MWNLKNKWTVIIKQERVLDQEHRHVVAREGGEGGVMDWESGISRRTRVYTEWINNKACCIAQGTIFNGLWSTTEKTEKNMKKDIHVRLNRSLCCTVEISAILYLNKFFFKKGTSLVVQWLRFYLPLQGATGVIPDQGTKTPHAG